MIMKPFDIRSVKLEFKTTVEKFGTPGSIRNVQSTLMNNGQNMSNSNGQLLWSACLCLSRIQMLKSSPSNMMVLGGGAYGW